VVAAHRVVMVALQLGSCAQGCHGYPTRSALVLEAPLSFQAPSPSSSIVDEFNLKVLSTAIVENKNLKNCWSEKYAVGIFLNHYIFANGA